MLIWGQALTADPIGICFYSFVLRPAYMMVAHFVFETMPRFVIDLVYVDLA